MPYAGRNHSDVACRQYPDITFRSYQGLSLYNITIPAGKKSVSNDPDRMHRNTAKCRCRAANNTLPRVWHVPDSFETGFPLPYGKVSAHGHTVQQHPCDKFPKHRGSQKAAHLSACWKPPVHPKARSNTTHLCPCRSPCPSPPSSLFQSFISKGSVLFTQKAIIFFVIGPCFNDYDRGTAFSPVSCFNICRARYCSHISTVAAAAALRDSACRSMGMVTQP